MEPEKDIFKLAGFLVIMTTVMFYVVPVLFRSIELWVDDYMWKHYRKDLNLRQSLISRRCEEFLNLLDQNNISVHDVLRDTEYCEDFVIKIGKVKEDIKSGKLTKEKYR